MIKANNDEVICPNCVLQFRAIPVNVQTELVELRADAERYRKIAALDWYVGPEYNTYNDVVIDDYDNFNISKESLDAAIDTAMEGQP